MDVKRLIVACTIFMIALLYTPGCYSIANYNENRGNLPAVAPDAAMVSDAAAPQNHQVPGTDGSSAASNRDGGGPRTDAGVREDARSAADSGAQTALDATQPRDSGTMAMTDGGATAPPAPGTAIGFLLAPTTCHGRRLPASTEGLGLAASGSVLWHLCYKTPTAMTSTSPLARSRPQSASVQAITERGSTELAFGRAPMVANPWTVSVLLALSPGQIPAFNVVNLYADGQALLAVDSTDSGQFPALNGELQAWQVAGDGTQMERPPQQGCRIPDRADGGNPFFLPGGTCARLELDCPALERLQCRNF